MKRHFQLLFATLAIAVPGLAQDWMQWGRNAQHTGTVRVLGQMPRRLLAELEYDPFSAQMQEEGGGSLLAHYQPPLSDGRDVFIPFKTGRYLSCSPPGTGSPAPCGIAAWDTQIWGQKRMVWRGERLVERWKFESDWKPIPDAFAVSGWEPVFHAAISQRYVYLPAAGGEVFRLLRRDGSVDKRIQPFGPNTDPNKFLVGPITIDERDNIYYNVLHLNSNDPFARTGVPQDLPGAWLVKVARDGTVSMADYRTLIPNAPTECKGTFGYDQLPWPPSPTAVPPSRPCLSQRPGINVAPAVALDGTIYTVSRAHGPNGGNYSYLIALNRNLTLKWAASLRGQLKDGCGVLLPIGATGGCRAGTPANGVDPSTNEAPAGQVSDLSTSSPVVAPDGSILYGAYTSYNHLRGHLFHFDQNGQFLNAHDFGWDTTPAVWAHDDTYSVILKENNYNIGSYCFDSRFCPPRGNGPYYMTQLDASLKVEWRFQNTNTQECSRRPDGSLECEPATPGGFEWCINAPAVDALGTVYANSEDGNIYVIGQGGKLLGQMFLHLALGAAYTPLSIGYDGKIYTENDGKIFVVGQ